MEVSLGIVAVVVLFSSILTYFGGKHLRLCYLIGKFHGPLALPIVGNTHSFKSDPREAFIQGEEVLNEYRQKTGGLLRIWYGSVPGIVVYGAKHMEVILSSAKHLKKGIMYRFVEPWLGKGLLTSTGEKWFHRRKMLTPTFHFSILQNFLEVFNEQSSILVKKMEKFADKPDPVNVFPHITHCVLDIICDTAMGKNINAQGDSGNEYVKAVLKMTDIVTKRGRTPWMWPDMTFDLTKHGKEQKRCLNILHGVTNKMIQERLREPLRRMNGIGEEDEVVGKQKRIAFLDMLLQMHREDESFTLKDIREEVDTFMFEGHDTTASAVSWAILQIGLYPEVQARLHEEIDEVFGNSDRPVTSDDISKLPYLNCVVKESLRIIPSVPVIMRSIEEDIILDEKVVPKQAIIMLHIYALHRDPEHFPDPERFDPDRFLPENVARRHPYAYIPFSAGPRNCIGQKFALMEDKVILINLLRKFSMESMQTIAEAKPIEQLIIRPADGNILVKFSLRK